MWASMRSDCRKGCRFVVGPHAQHPNGFFVREDFIDEVALDVDAPRTGAVQVADQLFIGGRVLERIDRQDGEKRLCFCFESSVSIMESRGTGDAFADMPSLIL